MPWHRVNSRVVGVDSGVIGVDSGVVGVDSGVVGGICHGAMAPWHLCCNCYNNAMAFAMAPWHLCYNNTMRNAMAPWHNSHISLKMRNNFLINSSHF